MGKDLYDRFQSARNVFHEVDDTLSFPLANLIFNGTENELKATENAQPALMAVSMAFVRVLEKEFATDIVSKARFLAGHSLGEYTALCAGGVISLADAAKILRVRGEAMAKACPTEGSMAAILGLDIETVERLVDEVHFENNELKSSKIVLQIANDNCSGQVVISGHESAVARAMKKAQHCGARKTTMLEVSGPFHCQLMEDAAAAVEDVLAKITFHTPVRPIISNVNARAEIDGFDKLLLQQLTERVRWRETVLFAAANSVSECVEIGSGKVLSGLAKRICPQMIVTNINSISSLDEIVKMGKFSATLSRI
jgi:[acyl-carrier-protein] S-malonyltransferase